MSLVITFSFIIVKFCEERSLFDTTHWKGGHYRDGERETSPVEAAGQRLRQSAPSERMQTSADELLIDFFLMGQKATLLS